jgi:hypothetical protein
MLFSKLKATLLSLHSDSCRYIHPCKIQIKIFECMERLDDSHKLGNEVTS